MSEPNLARLRLQRGAATDARGDAYDPYDGIPPTYVDDLAWNSQEMFKLKLRRGFFGEIELPDGVEAILNDRYGAPIDKADIVWIMTIEAVPHLPSRAKIAKSMGQIVEAQLIKRLGKYSIANTPVLIDKNMPCDPTLSENHTVWHTLNDTQRQNWRKRQHFSMRKLLDAASERFENLGLFRLVLDDDAADYEMEPASGMEFRDSVNEGVYIFRRLLPTPLAEPLS